MKLKIVKIVPQPYSRFHFGQMKMIHEISLSDTDSFCKSDTLFSGLINSYAKVCDSVDSFVEAFMNGKILISSLFYYIEKEGNKPIYLLPKPAFLMQFAKKEADGSHKKLNKIEFVSKEVWEAGLKVGEWLNETQYKIIDRKIVVTRNEFDSYQLNEEDKIFQLNSMPKSPQTNNKKETIFYQTDVIIHPIKDTKVGLYFLYKSDTENEIHFRNAVNILAYSGFGGEINLIGRTLLSPPIFGETLTFNLTSDKFSNLSLYNPDENELQFCEFYETSLRGGRRMYKDSVSNIEIHSKVVRMIDEGAVFISNEIKGRIVELDKHESKNNPILRYGKPLLIPINYE